MQGVQGHRRGEIIGKEGIKNTFDIPLLGNVLHIKAKAAACHEQYFTNTHLKQVRKKKLEESSAASFLPYSGPLAKSVISWNWCAAAATCASKAYNEIKAKTVRWERAILHGGAPAQKPAGANSTQTEFGLH